MTNLTLLKKFSATLKSSASIGAGSKKLQQEARVRIKKLGRGWAIVLVALLSGVSCSRDDPQSAGRGRVEVGNHELAVQVEGIYRGGATVILESGLGGGIDSWSAVRESLQTVTRVVSYDRAGSGGSQPGPRPRSAARIVEELRAALRQLEIDPPYLLVGHSVGGLYVRAFAGTYPDEVLGLVLVDPTMEFRESLSVAEVHTRLERIWQSEYARIQKLLDRVHPKMGAIAAQSLLQLEHYLNELPSEDRPKQRATWFRRFADRSRQVEGMLGLMSDGQRQELFDSLASMQVVNERPANGTPTTLLVAGKIEEPATDPSDETPISAEYIAWSRAARMKRFRDYIETIPTGTMQTIPDAGHNIPRDKPDAVVDAVRRMLREQ